MDWPVSKFCTSLRLHPRLIALKTFESYAASLLNPPHFISILDITWIIVFVDMMPVLIAERTADIRLFAA